MCDKPPISIALIGFDGQEELEMRALFSRSEHWQQPWRVVSRGEAAQIVLLPADSPEELAVSSLEPGTAVRPAHRLRAAPAQERALAPDPQTWRQPSFSAGIRRCSKADRHFAGNQSNRPGGPAAF